ncbi:RNA polymerase sigma factor RpoE [Rubripirellula tenax]|uniref:RNA polymerase sigma factor RpoE n=1 Tax=Rubripirellula tenax TaxID=2528015 RepID=A0A5C6FIU0_9BACT|nr:sigma-70 family RNA polymerase sigma factor [Rubripirellula tenax]TWU60503.1 RNA polymerase sigma factor RpoE [Rubripirellula tenax]
MNAPDAPETRLSLLFRVGDGDDQAAWDEFVQIYHPVIYRTARYKGLQDADAMDVAQTVLMSVGRALAKRPHDPSRARFRTWLNTVTRNAAINALRGKTLDRGTGDSGVQAMLNAAEAKPLDDGDVLEREYQKELFRTAARLVQPEFAGDTWQAFWRTTVDGEPIADVALDLGKQPGSVYAARSRIIRRLKQEIERLG